MANIELGDLVRDKITGFTGIAIGRSIWLYGCERIGIEPTVLRDGMPMEVVFFDEQRVETVEDNSPMVSSKTSKPCRSCGASECDGGTCKICGEPQKRGGPRNDDRGGTPSSYQGYHGKQWSSRRDG